MITSVDFLVACENAFAAKDSGNFSVIGIFDFISDVEFPITYPLFTIAAKVRVTSTDEHIFKVKITHESGKVWSELDIKTQGNTIYNLTYNFSNNTFELEGKYKVELIEGGLTRADTTISLRREPKNA